MSVTRVMRGGIYHTTMGGNYTEWCKDERRGVNGELWDDDNGLQMSQKATKRDGREGRGGGERCSPNSSV